MTSTTSTLLTALVLGITLMSVVGFAFAVQNLRYLFLQRVEEYMEKSRELVTAGAWHYDTYVLVEVRNIGTNTVDVRARVVVTYRAYALFEVTEQYVREFNASLKPFQSYFDAFDLRQLVPYDNISIERISITVSTGNSIYVFDPAPPPTSIVVPITRDTVSGSGEVTIQLPNGRSVRFTVKEFLACWVGHPRNSISVPVVDYARIYIADPQGVRSVNVSYGYDPFTQRYTNVSVSMETKRIRHPNGVVDLQTECHITSDWSLYGTVVKLVRGVYLVGPYIPGYDIKAFAFPKPFPAPPAVTARRSNVKTLSIVAKIPLPSNDTPIYGFLVEALSLYAPNGTRSIDVGQYYSQMIVVAQGGMATIEDDAHEVDVLVVFDPGYPILLVLEPESSYRR